MMNNLITKIKSWFKKESRFDLNTVRISKIKLNRSVNINNDTLNYIAELAESIRKIGLTQPILITSNNELLDGYCRVQACKMLGMTTIKAIIVNRKK